MEPWGTRAAGRADRFVVTPNKCRERNAECQERKWGNAKLHLNPNRFNAVYGAAKAADKAGKRAEARKYYAQLAELGKAFDGSCSELNEARMYLARR